MEASLLQEVARAIQMPEGPIASWGLSRSVEPAGGIAVPPAAGRSLWADGRDEGVGPVRQVDPS